MRTRALLDLIASRASSARLFGDEAVDMAAIELALLSTLQMLSEQADFAGLTMVASPLVALKAGEEQWSLPADFERFIQPSDDSDAGLLLENLGQRVPLRYRDPMSFQRLRSGTKGPPAWYTVLNDRHVRLDPIPDAAYTLTGIYIQTVTPALFDQDIPIHQPLHLAPMVLAQLAQDRLHASASVLGPQAEQARQLLLLANQREYQRLASPHPLVDLLALRAQDCGLVDQQSGRLDLSGLERRLLHVLRSITDAVDFDTLTVQDDQTLHMTKGERRYPLPPTFGRFITPTDDGDAGVLLLVGTQRVPLIYLDPQRFQRQQTTSQGQPATFTVTADRQLLVDPLPETTYHGVLVYIRRLDATLWQSDVFPVLQSEYLVPMALAQLALDKGHPNAAAFATQADEARALLVAANMQQRQRLQSTHPLVDLLALRAQDMGLTEGQTGRLDMSSLERRLLHSLRSVTDTVDFDTLTVQDDQLLRLSAGVIRYPLPAIFGRFITPTDDGDAGVLLVNGAARTPLVYRDPQQFQRLQTPVHGLPTAYTVTADRTLLIDPPPDGSYQGVVVYIRAIDRTLLTTQPFPLLQGEYLVPMALAQLAQDRGHPSTPVLVTQATEARTLLVAANARQRQRLRSANALIDLIALRVHDLGLDDGGNGKVDLTTIARRVVHCLEELTDTYDLDPVTVVGDPFMSTVENETTYTLPTDFKRFVNPQDADDSGLMLDDGAQRAILRYRNPWTFERMATTTAGRPAWFTVSNNQVRLDPPPDDNDGDQYTLVGVYIRSVTVETMSADTAHLPTASLIDMALGQYALDKGHPRGAELLVLGAQARSRLLNYQARHRQRFQSRTGRLADTSRPAFTLR